MNVSVHNEYGRLKSCLTAPPTRALGDVAPINAVQEHYFAADPPVMSRVRAEHRRMEAILRAAGVSVFHPPAAASPFQVFCRDVGFTIGSHFFRSEMKKPVRKVETLALEQWMAAHAITAQRCPAGTIEGGDVIVDAPEVLVGIGERTSAAAAEWLEATVAPEWRVAPIELAPGVLHLDCVVAVVAPETMIYCPELIHTGARELERRYPKRIRISPEQAFDMACNVLALGSTVVVESHQSDLIRELGAADIGVTAVDGTELRKFGGLFRCAVCPLDRSVES